MINFCFKKKRGLNLNNKKEKLLSRYLGLINRCVILQISLITTLICLIFTNSVFSQTNPSIKILEIESDEFIKGKIEGVKPEDYSKYKVVVYVKTDKWYIHPYERGGPGKSYANIKEDGTWTIGTIKREFPADYAVALLVRSDYLPPSNVENLGTIDYVARYKEEGRGRL